MRRVVVALVLLGLVCGAVGAAVAINARFRHLDRQVAQLNDRPAPHATTTQDPVTLQSAQWKELSAGVTELTAEVARLESTTPPSTAVPGTDELSLRVAALEAAVEGQPPYPFGPALLQRVETLESEVEALRSCVSSLTRGSSLRCP